MVLPRPCVFLVSCLAVWCSPLFPAPQFGQTSAPPASGRICTSNPVLSSGGRKKNAPRSKHPLPSEPPPACIEVKGEALEIQESLQAAVRDLKWRVFENHASEDSWTFTRSLNVEELESYADTKVLLERVEFEYGKAALLVRTTDLKEGFVRVQISAQIQGEGKSSDAVVKQPVTSWPLHSKGTLEQELIELLQSRYRHVE
jgi:hypothetical protein